MRTVPARPQQALALLKGVGVFVLTLLLTVAVAVLWNALVPPSPTADASRMLFIGGVGSAVGVLLATFTVLVSGLGLTDPLTLEIEGTHARVLRRSERLWSGHVSEVKPHGRPGERFVPTCLEFGPHRLTVGRVPVVVRDALAAFDGIDAGSRDDVPSPLREPLERL